MTFRRILVLLTALFIMGYDLGQRVQASTIVPGSSEDPVVSVGYVKDYLDEAFEPLTEKINSTKKSVSYISAKVQKIQEKLNLKVVFTIGKKTATIGTKKVEMETAPILHTGRTIIPLRFIGQALDAKMQWDNKFKKITYTRGNKVIILYVNNSKATINGKTVKLDVPPQLKSGRTLVPVRFVSENLDAHIDYETKTKTITIKGK